MENVFYLGGRKQCESKLLLYFFIHSKARRTKATMSKTYINQDVSVITHPTISECFNDNIEKISMDSLLQELNLTKTKED